MGEMVFFSSNSIGVFCYIIFAMHMFYDDEHVIKPKKVALEAV